MKHLSQKATLVTIGIVLTSLLVGLAFPNGFQNVNRAPRFMGVIELAEKIKNREKMLLVDLREHQEFEAFHIPTAVNIPLAEFDISSIQGSFVIYSGDDLLARKLWIQLPDSIRMQSKVLYGGVRDWYDKLLYPSLPFGEEVDGDLTLQKVHELCKFYGGYADFQDDPQLLNYYLQNLQTASWPKVTRSGALVRKGC